MRSSLGSTSPTVRLVAALAAAVVVGTALPASPAHADPAGSIGGTVRGPGGAPLAGVTVVPYVYNINENGWDPVRTLADVTDASGSYELTALPVGDPTADYIVEFVPGTDLTAEFFENAASESTATVIGLSDSVPNATADAVLSNRSRLTGTVENTTGAPLPGIAVNLYRGDANLETWSEIGVTAFTDDHGDYAFGDLVPGTYRVGFTDDEGRLASEYYDDVDDLEVAENIDVDVAETVGGIDAVLTADRGDIRNIDPPVIDGVAVVGRRLEVADLGRWSKADFTAAIQWLADGVATGATGDTYTPTAAQKGKRISVRVTASSPGYGNGTAVSEETAPVSDLAPLEPMDPPRVAGRAFVGEVLTAATAGTWTPAAPTTVRYQWFVDGDPVTGVTSATTYQIRPEDADGYVSVVAYGSRSGYGEGTNESDWIGPVVQRVVTSGAAPVVSGTPLVGSQLTASTGTWTPSTDLTYSYEWLVGSTVVPSATTSTYTPTLEDRGQPISVRVTASKLHHTPAVRTSAPTAAVDLPTVTAGTPTVEGTALVGEVLTAAPGTWPQGTTLAYQWLSNGVAVPSATGAAYPLTTDDLGDRLSVRVTGSRAGHHDGIAVSEQREPVSEFAVVLGEEPAVVGTPQVGTPVTATTGSWTPSDVTPAYQWFADGAPVPGAVQSSYTPVAADAGKALTVRVTAAREGYASARATSAPSAAVLAAPVPTVGGTAQVGQRLTATPGTWVAGPVSYQWLVGGAVVPGQTATTFLVPATALGKVVSVRVSAPGATSVTATTATVKAGVLRVTKPARVSGTPRVGKVLKVSAAVSPLATKVTYQWLRNGKAIARATKASYKLTAADRRKKVSVVVTFVRVGYTTVRSTSKPTGAIR